MARRTKTERRMKRAMIDIRQKKITFLREVSGMLSEALGFTVKVSLAKPGNLPADATPAMRKAARMTKKQARAQMTEAFAPFHSDNVKDL